VAAEGAGHTKRIETIQVFVAAARVWRSEKRRAKAVLYERTEAETYR
jgi:hypothetical protein